MWSIYQLSLAKPAPEGLAILLLAIVLLLAELVWNTHYLCGVLGVIALTVGTRALFAGPRRINEAVYLTVSPLLGGMAAYLAAIARRAREAKRRGL